MTNDPWMEIGLETPVGELRARRADSSHPYGFFWARDAKGQRLLVLNSAAVNSERQFPLLKGIAIEHSNGRLLLRLLEDNDREIFITLCRSLIERTRYVTPESQVVAAIIAHLERWQRFLGNTDRGLLSEQEVRGLLGELTFLDHELIERFGPNAISFWLGPAGHPQDYSIGTTLFEVKTRLAGAQPIITISSAAQLWNQTGYLYLVTYLIGQASEHGDNVISLAGVIAKIRSKLVGTEFVDLFEDRLIQVGYFDHDDYAGKYYLVSAPDFYEVVDGFPKITSDAIPCGVSKLNYGIEVAACIPFLATPDWIILGGSRGA